MRASQITESDLRAALRTDGVTDVAHACRATLERNGQIGVIPVRACLASSRSRSVQEGVQAVRLRLE
jgi:uncharacterized membrane protein YcaP (DUF421 family)